MKRFDTDLHTHTYYSDGAISPKVLVGFAKKKKIKNLALTDHNSVRGVEEAMKEGKKLKINIIPGVEVQFKGGEMLGYFIDYKNKGLHRDLKKAHKLKMDIKIKAKLMALHKFEPRISLSKLIKKFPYAKDNYYSYHIDRFLREECDYTEEQVDEIWMKTPIQYKKDRVLSPIQAIRLIKKYKGVAVWSHPWLSKKIFTEKNLKKCIKAGLKGLEFDNGDRNMWGRDPKFARKLKRLAKKYNLILTKGSDFHGYNTLKGKGHEIGNTLCSHKVVKQLESR